MELTKDGMKVAAYLFESRFKDGHDYCPICGHDYTYHFHGCYHRNQLGGCNCDIQRAFEMDNTFASHVEDNRRRIKHLITYNHSMKEER